MVIVIEKVQPMLVLLGATVLVKKYRCACYPCKGMGTQKPQQVYNGLCWLGLAHDGEKPRMMVLDDFPCRMRDFASQYGAQV